jgi:hypothetical protein
VERTLRAPAQARDTGRTNKTSKGARRQTMVTTVLESLRLYLQTFTLSSVLEDIKSWGTAGQSCFEKLLKKRGLRLPAQSIIDRVLPCPSG